LGVWKTCKTLVFLVSMFILTMKYDTFSDWADLQ
jgi:hypothetical protein